MYAQGARRAGRLVVVYCCPEDQALKVGVVVGRRVGRAVVRNRVRRRLRELLRQMPLAPGQAVVVTARAQAAAASYWELKEELSALLQELGALADTGPGGRRVSWSG